MRVAVIGAGSWGLALARKLGHQGKSVMLWVYEQTEYQELLENRSSKDYLPGITLPEQVQFSQSFTDFKDIPIMIMAVPSHGVRSVVRQMNTHALQPEYLVNVAKGIENETFLRMSQVILDELKSISSARVATLTGPSHAEEVSQDIPTAVVAASESLETAEAVQHLLNDTTFRVYTTTDIIGAELGGSVKNIIAIAAGILDGLAFGDNPKAALMTRGIAEIIRFGLAFGAREVTFSGLSGIGDLIVTCLSQHSRNRYVGQQLGQGKKLSEILSQMKMVAEGVRTTESVYEMAQKKGVEMPITEQVYHVLFHEKEPIKAVHDLMSRDPVHERHSM